MLNLETFFVFIFMLQASTALYYPQYFLAFPYKSCIGVSDHYWLDTATGIDDELNGLHYKSFIVQGLWRLNFDDREIIITKSSNWNYVCTILRPDQAGNYYPLKSVVKLAAGDLDDSFLTLYPLKDFDGEPIMINDQGNGNVERPGFSLRSWALTGSQPFTIFDGENFSGMSTCILPDDDAKSDKGGITVNWGEENTMMVRSVKFGCDLKTNRVIRGNFEKVRRALGNSEFIRFENRSKLIEIH